MICIEKRRRRVKDLTKDVGGKLSKKLAFERRGKTWINHAVNCTCDL